MISRDFFFSVANNLGDSVAFNLESDISAHCVSPADLAYSKLAAGREKDMEFVAGLLHHKIVRQVGASEANRGLKALANASEITGLPRDNFEVHEISKEEFERHRT
jgi:hypothetical protein